LDEGGDIWRVRPALEAAQASGIIDGSYEHVMPFRQREFQNAFIEWVILDSVKHRKAASKRLKRCFRIANMQSVNAFPTSKTVGNWIYEMFAHCEPDIIKEIANARSKISISFDGWGSKRERISVVGIVIHFINENYENVTRLIGLPELPGHRKAGVGKSLIFCFKYLINNNFVYSVVDLQIRYSAILGSASQ
jgi:hypothetical protein